MVYLHYISGEGVILMANITVRLDDDLKEEAKEILDDLGIDMTTAFKMFLSQVVMEQGIPFEVKRKSRLELAVKDFEEGRFKEFSSYESLLKDLYDED